MVFARWSCFPFVLWFSAALAAQNPLLDTAKLPAEPKAVATSPEPLSAEKRADILMARKMYREAAELYKQGPLDSAVIENKIGIAYHQMMKVDVARKYYERAMKIDSHYPEAINNPERT